MTTAKVVNPDLVANNGVVHVIDKVLIPPGVLHITQMLKVNSNFSKLQAYHAQTKLIDTLSEAGPFTLFAQLNSASIFSDFPTLADTRLAETLKMHVLPDVLFFAVISDNNSKKSPTLASAEEITFVQDTATSPPNFGIANAVGDRAWLSAVDIIASNGVIHVVDDLLLAAPPPD